MYRDNTYFTEKFGSISIYYVFIILFCLKLKSKKKLTRVRDILRNVCANKKILKLKSLTLAE